MDKYESGPGVFKRDALDLNDLEQLDLVAVISTIEHVGWTRSRGTPRRPWTHFVACQIGLPRVADWY